MDITLLSETHLTLSEIKEIIEKNKKERKQLNFRETKTSDYINLFCKLKPKEARELKTELTNLNITRLKERHTTKIIDLLPEDIDTLKIIFTGEDITLKTEDLNRIIEVIKKYA